MRIPPDGGFAVQGTRSAIICQTPFSRLSRDDRGVSIMHALLSSNQGTFRVLTDVENTPESVLRAMPLGDTVFKPIAEHLLEEGHPTATIGGVMDVCGWTKDDVHVISCHCHTTSDFITPHHIAGNIAVCLGMND